MITTILRKTTAHLALLVTLLAWTTGAAAADGNIRFYATPEDAAQALATAIKAGDSKELLTILGPKAAPLVSSGDAQTDGADRAAFASAYEKKHELVALQPEQAGKEQAKGPAKGKANARELRVLEIGENNWPFPIPLVREPKSGRWFFDTTAGMQELLDRRIGNNELSAIQVCLAYVDAQNDYYRRNPEKAPIAHFAQKITSSPGKRDGLYWLPKEGEEQSPLGSLAASAEDKGKAASAQAQSGGGAYHGYRYRILTAQGANAVHGAYNYVENGLMFGGFALLAYPETYGVTGVMSFMVNQDGTVFEKNLGKSTASLARRITVFNPDRSWAKVKAD